MATPTRPVGSDARATARFRNDLDELSDPTAVVVTVERPDGTTLTPTVDHESLGVFSVVFQLTQKGRWDVKAVGSGSFNVVVEGSVYASDERVT